MFSAEELCGISFEFPSDLTLVLVTIFCSGLGLSRIPLDSDVDFIESVFEVFWAVVAGVLLLVLLCFSPVSALLLSLSSLIFVTGFIDTFLAPSSGFGTGFA